MNDDELRARLRASFQETAARTPIGPERAEEIRSARPARGSRIARPARPMVAAFSAAAAVVAVAGVVTVVATRTPGAGPGVETGAGLPASNPALTPTSSAGPSIPGSPSASCVPENYYVIASARQLAGMTYLPPATPAGYHLYGAWGTIARNGCADSATWYVEYDADAGDPHGYADIDLQVTRADGSAAAEQSPPPGAQPVTVAGREGVYFVLNKKIGALEWTSGGMRFLLFGPLGDGTPGALVAVAQSLVLVPPGDARIVAPPGCDVPAGSVCGGPKTTSPPTTSPTATSPTATPAASSLSPPPASLAAA